MRILLSIEHPDLLHKRWRLVFGGLAVMAVPSFRPMALRPRLSTGLPLSVRSTCKVQLNKQKRACYYQPGPQTKTHISLQDFRRPGNHGCFQLQTHGFASLLFNRFAYSIIRSITNIVQTATRRNEGFPYHFPTNMQLRSNNPCYTCLNSYKYEILFTLLAQTFIRFR